MFSSVQLESSRVNSSPECQGGCRWRPQQGSLSHLLLASVPGWQALGAQLHAAKNNVSSYSREAEHWQTAGYAGRMFAAGNQRSEHRLRGWDAHRIQAAQTILQHREGHPRGWSVLHPGQARGQGPGTAGSVNDVWQARTGHELWAMA